MNDRKTAITLNTACIMLTVVNLAHLVPQKYLILMSSIHLVNSVTFCLFQEGSKSLISFVVVQIHMTYKSCSEEEAADDETRKEVRNKKLSWRQKPKVKWHLIRNLFYRYFEYHLI